MTTIAELRKIAAGRVAERPQRKPRPVERCDLCGTEVEADHRHLLQIVDRQIVCACEACFARRSGEAEFRPVGRRVVWLDEFVLRDEIWGAFRIPIGLAFFFQSTVIGEITALYPSPAGATESELDMGAWAQLVASNPILATLEPDTEALIVNRMGDRQQFAIAPIDRCYALVGLVKVKWQGISGGNELGEAIQGFFDDLERDSV
jgi:hypothetical protein